MSQHPGMTGRTDGAMTVAEAFPEAGQRSDAVRVCLISVAGELFAVDLSHVREVFKVETVTPVPGMPPVLMGVTNLRGAVIPVIDLRVMMGQATGQDPMPFVVIIRHGIQQVGVLVDDVPQLASVSGDQILASPSGMAGGKRPFVSSVLRVADRMGSVVEVPTLLAYVESGGA